MWNRRCKNVSTIPGRISDTCDIERAFHEVSSTNLTMYPIIFSLIVNLSTIMAYFVASVFFFGVITFVTVCTEVAN
jgi:hypothetical protein